MADTANTRTHEHRGSSYADMHQVSGVGTRYDGEVYAPGSYDDQVWSLQRPHLEALLRDFETRHGRFKYLDFACGTGRIISVGERFAGESTGVDISPHMIERAATRVSSSRLIVANILTDPSSIDADYDVITAFRFFLNTEHEMRVAVMASLASRLRTPDSLLVFNIHGNARSTLAVTSMYRRLRGWGPAWLMSHREVRALVEGSGLEIVDRIGFGLWPRRLYRTRVGGVLRAIDRWAIARRRLRSVSHDLLYVCRKAA
jgi:SAM-dependent methyltransferase